MELPILTYYSLSPFYQNAQTYIANPDLALRGYFNDTFHIVGVDIDDSALAWDTDIEHLGPLPNGSESGEHYAVWKRPAAMPEVRKKYGYLHHRLRQGDVLTILIHTNFPSRGDGAQRKFVIMSPGDLGAPLPGLVLLLLLSALLSCT